MGPPVAPHGVRLARCLAGVRSHMSTKTPTDLAVTVQSHRFLAGASRINDALLQGGSFARGTHVAFGYTAFEIIIFLRLAMVWFSPSLSGRRP